MCVRSSITFYGNFNLDMDRSPGFGSTNTNCSPYSDLVSLRLRTSLVLNLANISNSPDRSTKSTQSEIASLLLFVSTRFQVLFHSPPGVLFTFPSQYFSTIGHRLVFRLGGWSPRLPTGFLVSRGTLDPARWLPISLTRLSRPLVCFPKTVQLSSVNTSRSPQPRWTMSFGLAYFLFARRYSENRFFFLFLPLLRCFSSRRFPSITYWFTYGWLSFPQPGFPIRTSADRYLFAIPRGFSQLITSFFGFRCQGIPLVLLLAWPS